MLGYSNTLSAFHDIEGLERAHGRLRQPYRLSNLSSVQDQPYFDVTGYGYEIYEMSEMANARMAS